MAALVMVIDLSIVFLSCVHVHLYKIDPFYVLCIGGFFLSVFAVPPLPSTMTMEELLKSLQKKCRVECEEAHRQLVCALNGLAGIHIIRSINPHSGTCAPAHTFPWESV